MLKECELHLHPYEADIIRFFSSGDVASDPRNHCVPVYDVVPVSPEGVPAVLIVTPLLRQYNDPPFETVGQVVDFFTQIFEVSAACFLLGFVLMLDGAGFAVHARTQCRASVTQFYVSASFTLDSRTQTGTARVRTL
jgi:hypothetical protein